MKKSGDCQSIQEIREIIDEIDCEILSSFGKRNEYVKAIVKFKSDKDEIIAAERQLEVLQKRKEWAKEFGLDPDLIEKIYKILINWNIQQEMEIFRSKEKANI